MLIFGWIGGLVVGCLSVEYEDERAKGSKVMGAITECSVMAVVDWCGCMRDVNLTFTKSTLFHATRGRHIIAKVWWFTMAR